MNMKRFLTLFLTALMTLSLVACGTSGSGSSSTSASITSASSIASDASPALIDQATSMPTVTISKETKKIRSNDKKVVLLNSEWNTAEVTIPDNDIAQKAIQADLDRITKTFLNTSEEYRKEAAEFYQNNSLDPDSSAYAAYYNALTITQARCDNTIISLVFDETNYTGGAHGTDNRYARNYDATTGKVLTLKDLGNGISETANDKIPQFVKKIHKKDGLFFDSIKKANLEDVITDNMFYFDKDGLVFIAGQYLLQSYAEGIVEFTISYDDLKGKLEDAYNLGGGNTQCNTQLGIYTLRKNGSLDTSKVDYSDHAGTGSASTDK